MMYGSWDMVCDRQMNRQMDRQKKWHGAPPKNENWAYLWTNSVTFYTVCFYCMPSWGLSKYIKTNHQTACFYHIKSFFFFFFFKKKEIWNQFPCLISALLLKKNIYLAIFYNWPNFILLLPFFHEILGNMCIATVC